MTLMIEKKLLELEAAVSRISDEIGLLAKMINRQIEWEEQVSESGIQISGPTRITRKGTLISIVPQIVGQNSVATLCVVRNEKGDVGVISGPFKLVD